MVMVFDAAIARQAGVYLKGSSFTAGTVHIKGCVAHDVNCALNVNGYIGATGRAAVVQLAAVHDQEREIDHLLILALLETKLALAGSGERIVRPDPVPINLQADAGEIRVA